MISPACNAAPKIALNDEARAVIHGCCPGGVVGPAGDIEACECDCHGGQDRTHTLSDDERALLPRGVVSRGVGRGGALESEKSAFVASESTSEASARPGRCECGCGAPVARRFLPGHDAKLKSRLTREAASSDPLVRLPAKVELERRGWS